LSADVSGISCASICSDRDELVFRLLGRTAFNRVDQLRLRDVADVGGANRTEFGIGLRDRLTDFACDMGSGNGYHTIPMAKAVAPDGKVFASEIQQEMLTMLDERAKKEGINNIVPVLGTQTDAKLPDASCDLILLVDVYHEFSDPAPMLTAMKKALKPGGQIVLVEFRAEDESVPIKPEHKMSKEQIMKEMNANGLRLSRSYDKLPWQHMLWFEAGQADAAPINNMPASKP
jgi:SAM-dependent methyltransferase